MKWTTACPDWEDRIVAKDSLITSPPLFADEAAASLDVFKALRVVDVPGTPTFGELGEQWIFDFVAAIFGSCGPDGNRLIREFFLTISKKNGKSTLAAGIMLTALIRNWRRSNEVLILAPTIEAAGNSFNPAADMVRADPDLDSSQGGFLLVQDHVRTITHLTTNAKLKIIAADGATVVGKKGGFILIDELWEFGKVGKADAMLREATGGLISRPEGFVVTITTQADAPPAGVFKDKLDYARDVRDGRVVDPKFLPVIYEFPKEMVENKAYLDPANFYVTNPNIGRSVSAEWLEDELRKEMSKGPETRNTFLAKHLNIEIGMNMRSNRWAGADFWESRAIALKIDELIERSEVIVVGIDGGGLDDLFGLTVVGREPAEIAIEVEGEDGLKTVQSMKRWLSWSHAWCHKGVLERRKSIAPRLLDFQKAGDLTIVGDELADISGIVRLVETIDKAGKLYAVSVDPAGLGELADALAAIGVTQEAKKLLGAPQGFGMMNAIKTAERKLANGTLHHAKSAMMDWCVGNLKIEATATAVRATKQNAGDAKIDPVMALFDAVIVMTTNPQSTSFDASDWIASYA